MKEGGRVETESEMKENKQISTEALPASDCGVFFSFLVAFPSLTFFLSVPTFSVSILSQSVAAHSIAPPFPPSLFSQIRPAELQAAGLVNWNRESLKAWPLSLVLPTKTSPGCKTATRMLAGAHTQS